jgi:hypothetical protein
LFAGLALCIAAADLNTQLDTARAARRQNDIAAAQSAYDSALELAMSEPDRRLTGTAVEVSTFYTQQNNLGSAQEFDSPSRMGGYSDGDLKLG